MRPICSQRHAFSSSSFMSRGAWSIEAMIDVGLWPFTARMNGNPKRVPVLAR